MRYIQEYIVDITDDGKISRRLPKFEDFISNGWLEWVFWFNVTSDSGIVTSDSD